MRLCTNVAKLGLKCVAALCLAAYAAYGTPVLYTFNATTRASPGSPSHVEMFELETQDFLPVGSNGGLVSFLSSDPALISCTACLTDPTVPTLHFLRGSSSDLIQFADRDGTTRVYFFPLESLSNVGSYDTLPGINVAVGTLTVAQGSAPAAVPEPSSVVMLLAGLAAIGIGVRRRRAQARVGCSAAEDVGRTGQHAADCA